MTDIQTNYAPEKLLTQINFKTQNKFGSGFCIQNLCAVILVCTTTRPLRVAYANWLMLKP